MLIRHIFIRTEGRSFPRSISPNFVLTGKFNITERGGTKRSAPFCISNSIRMLMFYGRTAVRAARVVRRVAEFRAAERAFRRISALVGGSVVVEHDRVSLPFIAREIALAEAQVEAVAHVRFGEGELGGDLAHGAEVLLDHRAHDAAEIFGGGVRHRPRARAAVKSHDHARDPDRPYRGLTDRKSHAEQRAAERQSEREYNRKDETFSERSSDCLHTCSPKKFFCVEETARACESGTGRPCIADSLRAARSSLIIIV